MRGGEEKGLKISHAGVKGVPEGSQHCQVTARSSYPASIPRTARRRRLASRRSKRGRRPVPSQTRSHRAI
jgi:hypothetical protein